VPVCAFCGREFAGETRDHVPPKGLFGDGPKDDLITVPACRACNEGSSKDDEYFKLLAVEWEASAHPVAAGVMESVRRSLLIPQKSGYRKHLLKHTRPADLYTPGGLFVKAGGELDVNVGRLGRVAARVIRGLYYHHNGWPVPAGYFAYCNLLNVFLTGGWPKQFRLAVRDELVPALLALAPVEVGKGVFRYWWGVSESDPKIAFCCWDLYGRYLFFGFIGLLDDEPTLPDTPDR